MQLRKLFIGLFLASLLCMSEGGYWDYIVIGAGPSGLQLGYFLQQAGRNYVIMERSDTPGNFFTNYPRHDMLISINKRFTGKTNKEFNFRHDWNSLISHDESLQYRHYSKEMFPPRETMPRYLADFANRLNLSIQYNTEISGIERNKTDQLLYMKDQKHNVHSCRTLIIATGLWIPHKPDYGGSDLVEGYESISTNPNDFEGQSVLILGKGNSAYEVADRIYGATSSVHMVSRSRLRLSWETHYVGDLRAVNNDLLDTYQLKSLDGIMEGDLRDFGFKKKNGRIFLAWTEDDEEDIDNFPAREGYDRVIRCLGWVFDDAIFKSNSSVTLVEGDKYPNIAHDYQSVNIPGVYYAGTLTHSLDHRKSAGGFIHGFRYTAQVLHRLLEWKNHRVPWPSVTQPTKHLMNHIVKRVNEASAIYQMFSVLADVVAINEDGKEYTYFESFPVKLTHAFAEYAGFEVKRLLVVVLEYGQNYSGPGSDVFRRDRATGEADDAHNSNFLHPVLYYFSTAFSEKDLEDAIHHGYILPRPDKLHHVVEDFLTSFTAEQTHILPLRRFLDEILKTDHRHIFAPDCLALYLTMTSVPPNCEQYLEGQGLVLNQKLIDLIPEGIQFQLS